MKTTPNIAPASANGQPKTPTTTGTTPVANSPATATANSQPETVRESPVVLALTPVASTTATATAPKPEPTPAPAAPVDPVAERTARLFRINTVAAHLDKLDDMARKLAEFTYDLERNDERSYSTISLHDDKGNSFYVRNGALAAKQVKFLKTTVGEKIAELRSEFLSITV